MTVGELVSFFGATWRILNHRLLSTLKCSPFHPAECVVGHEAVLNGRECVGYAPLYPLLTIIALSFHLDSTEAYLFRKYVCQRLQKPASVITPIFLLGSTDN